MRRKPTNAEQVADYISACEPETAAVVNFLRATILSVDPVIGEQIKWNSPSFYYTCEMKSFDARQYKRDIVVLNLHRAQILLVFPTGAVISDDSGALEGNYTDGRKIVKIKDLKDAQDKADPLKAAIRDWLSKVEKA